MSRAESIKLGVSHGSPDVLPGLDRMNERLAHALRNVFANLGHRAAIVGTAPGRVVTYDEWKDQLPGLCSISQYKMRQIKGSILVVLPSPLVHAMVDRFYGGSGCVADTPATFSPAEDRFCTRLADWVIDALVVAWGGSEPLTPSLCARATSPQDSHFMKGKEPIAIQTITIDGSVINFIFPLRALQAFPHLSTTIVDVEDEAPQDPVWQARMADAAMNVRLPIRAVLARPDLPVRRLLSLKPGDFIPLCLPSLIPITIAGRIFAHGSVGESNGRVAMKINHMQHGNSRS
jgi:flagellar motor switch protein FliM